MSQTHQNFSHQVLAARGIAGHRQYRIPALAVSARGTVLAAYDARPNLDDLPNTIDLLVRRSFDHGLTWGPQQNIRTGTGLNGYGDPSLLVDQLTGRIFCFHAAGTHAGFFEALEGLEPEDAVQHVDLSYSDDDGQSWTHRRLTAQLKRAGIAGIFAAAGAGIQLAQGPYAGRLIQQMVILLRGEIRAASAYSDDHGENWVLGEPTSTEANENKVVELPDGKVLLNSRAKNARLQAISEDGGHSYGPLYSADSLPDPSDNGSIFKLPSTGAGDEYLLATNNRDTSLRRNTVLSASGDHGQSWKPAATIWAGSSAYSTGAILADGSLGVLYERNGYREIVFARMDAQHLSAEAVGHKIAEYQEAEINDFCMVLRSITPGRPKHWVNVGQSHVISAQSSDWGVHTWKEIGQGYADAQQILGTREAQETNYGPVAQGLRAGDILAFTGRFSNTSALVVNAAFSGNFDGDLAQNFPEVALNAGEESLYFTPTYTITRADIAQGRAIIRCVLEAGGRNWIQEFDADTVTGEVKQLAGG
ncbi:exo-alpha-sialidase [Arthrobacter sp. MYb227]|uniref:sialidase family protein n=1 Tax=Arthrobacter sp. MYb227 TaxID=1848601 RepID=UPI000CFC0F36|nr:sialidase family protein [Arthrobacter sp. MYb227]PQZ89586.1 exo-alpha-sialidase [Arthrobacter sp. MYb227]